MKKLLMILLFAALFSTGLVSAAADITVDDVILTVIQGASVQGTLPITNEGEMVNITIMHNNLIGPGGWNIPTSMMTVDPSEHENVANGETVQSLLTVETLDVYPVGQYHGTINFITDRNGIMDAAQADFTVTITALNHAPVIENIDDQNAVVGQEFTYLVQASDEDDDDLTYEVETTPSSTLSIDANTGQISWTPTSSGTITVTVTVSDGTLEDSDVFTITAAVAGGSIEFDSVIFGDEDQDRGVTLEKIITVRNQGSKAVTDLQLTSTLPSRYDVSFTYLSTTIPTGGATEVTMHLFVPLDQDSGSHELGSVTGQGMVEGIPVFSQIRKVSLETENMLYIKRVEIDIDGDTERVSDDENVETDKKGVDVTVTVELDNRFSNSDDVDIEDIEVSILQEDDLDWDEVEDADDMDYNDEEIVTFNLDIPSDADEDDYDIVIKATGTDENGAEHTMTFEFSLELDLDDENIDIADIRFTPSSVDCSDTMVTMEVTLRNIGSEDQDSIVLRAENDELDLDYIVRGIEIDEGDDTTLRISIPIEDADPGTYYITTTVYTSSNVNDDTDIETGELTIGSCSATTGTTNGGTTSTGTTSGTGVDITTTPGVSVPTSNVVASASGRPSFIGSNSPGYLTLLVGVIVLVIILIVVLLAVALRK